MAIVTFWSEVKKEVGQTATAIAVATQMAIEHNFKILLISTYNDNELNNAFWTGSGEKKGLAALFGNQKKINIDSGIEGIERAVASNKLTPELITNYTKILFKNKLEILPGYVGDDYENILNIYPEVISNASMYYDMVIVDLIKDYNGMTRSILENSQIVAYGINQKYSSIDKFLESKEKGFLKGRNNIVSYIGRYDKYSKYTIKNISRDVKEKNNMNGVSYNTLFSEAIDEGNVDNLLLKLKTIKGDDKNLEFSKEVSNLSESIIYKIEELKMNKSM